MVKLLYSMQLNRERAFGGDVYIPRPDFTKLIKINQFFKSKKHGTNASNIAGIIECSLIMNGPNGIQYDAMGGIRS